MEKKAKIAGCTVFGLMLMPVVCFAFVLVFLEDPSSDSALWYFHKRYDLARDKRAMLQKFDRQLSAYNGGYLPGEIDVFLWKQFNETRSQDERVAIAEFFALRSRGRASNFIKSEPVGARQEMIEILMDRLDDYEGYELSALLIQIENLRLGDSYGKPYLGDGYVDGVWALQPDVLSAPKETFSWPTTEDERAAEERLIAFYQNVKLVYRVWWERYPTWEERMQNSPLEGTEYGIGEP